MEGIEPSSNKTADIRQQINALNIQIKKHISNSLLYVPAYIVVHLRNSEPAWLPSSCYFVRWGSIPSRLVTTACPILHATETVDRCQEFVPTTVYLFPILAPSIIVNYYKWSRDNPGIHRAPAFIIGNYSYKVYCLHSIISCCQLLSIFLVTIKSTNIPLKWHFKGTLDKVIEVLSFPKY